MGAFTDLPEPIIHHIQSFLTPKEFGQTALLSKSWHDAWWNRPTLVIDQTYFEGLGPFMEFAKNTFRRHRESKLSTDTFMLRLTRNCYGYSGLAEEWTSEALRMGATEVIFHNDSRLTICVPMDELFESENIVKLCLNNVWPCNLQQIVMIKCTGLKSLTLSFEPLTQMPNDLFFNIISCCPLIENLSLSDARLFERPGTTTISLGKLRSLVVCKLDHHFHALLLGDMLSKFPILKDLTLTLCLPDLFLPEEALTIASNSLEIFNFTVDHNWFCNTKRKMRRVELHLPSIHKFTYQVSRIIPDRWRHQVDQWDSHILIKKYLDHELSAKWFRRLNKFIKKALKSLSSCEAEDVTIVVDAECLPTRSFSLLLDGLFRIYRPREIDQRIPNNSGNTVEHELLQFLDDLNQVIALQPMDSTGRLEFQLKWKSCSVSNYLEWIASNTEPGR